VKAQTQTIIYTILAGDKPVAAQQATGTQARKLLKEKCFMEN
jgi:hypothetical protein